MRDLIKLFPDKGLLRCRPKRTVCNESAEIRRFTYELAASRDLQRNGNPGMQRRSRVHPGSRWKQERVLSSSCPTYHRADATDARVSMMAFEHFAAQVIA